MDAKKTCPRCHLSFPLEFFKLLRNGKRQPYCSDCIKIKKQESYQRNREKILAKQKEYQNSHKAQIDAYQLAYAQLHREEKRIKAQVYRRDNADEVNRRNRERTHTDEYHSWQRDYYKKQIAIPEIKARYRSYSRKAGQAYYQRNRTQILAQKKTEYYQNLEESRLTSRESVRKWRSRHPDTIKYLNSRRKALLKGAIDEVKNKHFFERLKQWQLDLCYYCNESLVTDDSPEPHIEHILAITNGGPHNPDNLVYSCRSCNLSKAKKRVWEEWQPTVSPINDYNSFFLYQAKISSLWGENAPLKVLSTFLITERNLGMEAKEILPNLKKAFPNDLLIFDQEWSHHRSAIDNLVMARMGKCQTFQARKTELVEIDTDDARRFLEENHFQGFGRGTVYLGLIHQDELIGLASWLEGEQQIELNRLAFKGRVIGGFGKLVSGYVHKYWDGKRPIISFVDPRISDGHSYEKVGFKFLGSTALPIYYYVNPTGVYHRRSFMKQYLKTRLINFDPQKTEYKNARMNGYYRLWGFRQFKYQYFN